MKRRERKPIFDENGEPLYALKELARMLRIPAPTLYSYCSRGLALRKISRIVVQADYLRPYTMVGKLLLFRQRDVEDFLRRMEPQRKKKHGKKRENKGSTV